MANAKNGDTVRVHYTGTLEDGTQFDSSMGRDPMEFTLGEGRLIKGFENAIMGMGKGDKKTVEIPAEEAYGERRDELVIVVQRDQLPPDIDPAVGESLELQQGDQTFAVQVTDTSPDSITLDANHPLAGKALKFEIELVAIV